VTKEGLIKFIGEKNYAVIEQSINIISSMQI